MANNINKTVLLHERKRHTTRCVASTPSVVLTWGVSHPCQGVPHPCQGVPHLGYLRPHLARWVTPSLLWGVPHLGYPPYGLDLARVPRVSGPDWGTPIWTWPGYPPSGPGQGTPPPNLDLAGVPSSHLNLARYPPPPPPPWTDRCVKTLPSRRTVYAGGKNVRTHDHLCHMQQAQRCNRLATPTRHPTYIRKDENIPFC